MPAALAISAFAPWAVTPLLMIGGAFLCFEGFEKLAHKFLHSEEDDAGTTQQLAEARGRPGGRPGRAREGQDQGRRAHRLHPVGRNHRHHAGHRGRRSPSRRRLAVLVGIALLMTVGVYGLVAGIVKLDDVGLYLSQRASAAARAPGPRPAGRGALADEGAVRRRHRRHVPGRRRHPGARHAGAAPRDRRPGPPAPAACWAAGLDGANAAFGIVAGIWCWRGGTGQAGAPHALNPGRRRPTFQRSLPRARCTRATATSAMPSTRREPAHHGGPADRLAPAGRTEEVRRQQHRGADQDAQHAALDHARVAGRSSGSHGASVGAAQAVTAL